MQLLGEDAAQFGLFPVLGYGRLNDERCVSVSSLGWAGSPETEVLAGSAVVCPRSGHTGCLLVRRDNVEVRRQWRARRRLTVASPHVRAQAWRDTAHLRRLTDLFSAPVAMRKGMLIEPRHRHIP